MVTPTLKIIGFTLKTVFYLEFQPEFGFQLRIPILIGAKEELNMYYFL